MASPILFIFFLLLLVALPISVHSSGGFSIDLIHRDSPSSPFHNSSLSHSDRLRAAARRSISRANRFRASSSTVTATAANIFSPLIPDHHEYLMSLDVGTPPFKIMLVVDTGSDYVWTQCKPCVECYKQNDPIFNPSASSTYNTVSYNANGSPFVYSTSYGDGSRTAGILSTETFTFSYNSSVSILNIVFGCSHKSTGWFHQTYDGVVGLGGGPLSLASQLASSVDNKFSYCLVPHSAANTSSLLSFGDRAQVNGPNAITTPMVNGERATFYTVSLKDISIGDEKVGSGQGDIVIDSGTALTILDESMMAPLANKVAQAVSYRRVKVSQFDLCFDVSSSTSGGSDLEFPELTFEFSGGPVKLPMENTFMEVGAGVMCMAIVSSGYRGVRIFGSVAQQNMQVGYDLGAREVTFAPALAVGGSEGGGASSMNSNSAAVRVSCVFCMWTVAWACVLLVGIL